MQTEGYASLVTSAFKRRVHLFAEAEAVVWETAMAGQLLIEAFEGGGKVLAFGNGGSAADAQHFAAELVGRFKEERGALPAVALTTDTSILTAVANDYGYDEVFARQVEALGSPGDIVIALSSSGRSPNVVRAVERAVDGGLCVLALTGAAETPLSSLAEVHLAIPSMDTALVQEAHSAVLHVLCELVDTSRLGVAPPGSTTDIAPSTGTGAILATLDALRSQRIAWRRAGLRVVSTTGCFDVLHPGHIQSLTQARRLGDVLVVGLNSDPSVRRLKGPSRPVHSFADRRETLLALRAVDVVVEIGDDPSAFIDALAPNVHCKGAEYRAASDAAMPERAIVKRNGGTVRYLPMVAGSSTSVLLGRLHAGP